MTEIHEGELLWSPREDFVRRSNELKFRQWLLDHRQVAIAKYQDLWEWSVSRPQEFWSAVWEFFGVESDTPYKQVVDRLVMPGAKWFEGAHVNYAEHLLRHERVAGPNETVFYHASERRPLEKMSWQSLGSKVRILATQLRALGVRPGDAVVSYMPNIPETAIAMMATTAIGAVWSSAAPEFGVKTVIERFVQLQPKVLFAADGYRFGGKDYSRVNEVTRIAAALTTLEQIVWVPYLDDTVTPPALANLIGWPALLDQADIPRDEFRFERVPYDHPLWALFSSGTTGLPKAIVHSHVGILVEQLKSTFFHVNLNPHSVMFFYSTTGWMMWNALLGALLQGSSVVLYDGSPVHPGPDFLWDLAARTRATNFGASPTFVQIMERAGLRPGEKYDLSALEGVLISGAPSTPETFEWFYRCVKKDLWVTSQSGGTEICSGFVGATPTLPVYAGEIQTRLLGMDVHAWNEDGTEVCDEVGELVCTTPFPSMPIYFLNDPEGRRYHESYFDHYPGVWRHGDFIKFNSRGGCYIYGRSDSTLNRHGVRIGTAEIYRAVEQIPEVADSLIVCCELPGGNFYMPLFVKLKPGSVIDGALKARIADKLRQDCSPRHVPDAIHEAERIPYTLTGKKMEVPIRKLLMGWPLEKAASRDAMMDPGAIDWYLRFAQDCPAYRQV